MCKKLITVTFLAVACVFLGSCRKAGTAGGSNSSGTEVNGYGDDDSETNLISPGSFFTLDYTPYAAEKDDAGRKASAAERAQGRSAAGKQAAAGIIPGLRKLSAYETKYSDKVPADDTLNREGPEKAASGAVQKTDKPFTVKRLGAEGRAARRGTESFFLCAFFRTGCSRRGARQAV